jgi:hypothetical protein
MGATIYPNKEDISDMPLSEKRVYELLKGLSENFIIFHSVQWVKRGHKWKSTWKENDFLILNKKLGMLVLEVKGGKIEYKDGLFHQTNILTGEVNILSEKKKNDPLSQAIDGVYHYRNLIDTIEVQLGDRFPVEAAVWFSSSQVVEQMQKFPLAYREVSGAVLGYEDFTKGSKAIYDIYDFYCSRNKVNITDEEFYKIVELLATDFELITAPSVKKGELEQAFLKLTNEQTGLLDYISEQKNATIQGVAGTGKTLIAKEAARRFGVGGKKVLFLCFNKYLFQFLMHQYPYDNVTYYNLHTLISRYGDCVDDLSKPEDRAKALLKIGWDALDFDDIIVDEGQDFINDEIMYFKEMAEIKDGRFFIFYDKNQRLTTEDVPEWIQKSECKLLLTKNCRNTYEIALTSYNVIDVELNQKLMMISGDKTSISFVKGAPLIKLGKLISFFTNDTNGYEYSDIVILSLKAEDKSILNDVHKITGIPISRVRNNSSVFYTNVYKFKGLESRVIITVDVDKSCFVNEEKKRAFYVACSRATQRLALYINGDEAEVKNIADAISNSKFAPQGKIAMKTQASIMEL